MPQDFSKLSPEEKKATEANLRTAIESYQRDLAALTGAAAPASNGGGGDDLSKKVTQEEADATLFDKLPPGERTRLYLEDRPTFDKLKGAAETRNMRRLLAKAYL